MRGICRLLLCASAAALSGGAWAQDMAGPRRPLTPDDKAAIAARLDKLEAEAKELRRLLAGGTRPTQTYPVPRTGPEWQFSVGDTSLRAREIERLIAALDQYDGSHEADADHSESQRRTDRESRKADARKQAMALRELDADSKRYRQDWLTAIVEVEKAEEAIKATKLRIKRYEARSGEDLAAVIKAENELLQSQEKNLAELAAKVKQKYDVFDFQERAFATTRKAAMASLPQAARSALAMAQEDDKDRRQEVIRTAGNIADCTLDEPQKVRPNDCRFLAEAVEPATTRRSEGTISLPDRPVDRRGITTQLTTNGDKTSVTLKLAGQSRFRVPEVKGDEFSQRSRTLSYSLGITADVADSKSRVFGEAEDEDTKALDRLDERVKLVGSIGFNWFDTEKGASWNARAKKLRDDAAKACRDDQAAPETAFPSTCEGSQLLEWIFASDGKGAYRNAKHVEAFNAVYWGPAEKVARAGIGLTGELATPRLKYFPFTTTEEANTLNPGKMKEVVDLTNIPAEFYAGKPLPRRPWTYAIGAYGFYRLGDSSPTARAVTFIPSITYKREFEKPDKITICPVPTPGTQIVTTELCQTISPNDGEINHVWAPAIEARIHLPNTTRLVPWLVPSIGLAPKFSFEQLKNENRRYSFDLPLWLALDAEGKLSGGIALQHQWGGLKHGDPREDATSISIFVSTTFDLGSK